MKVSELIEHLKNEDQDRIVVLSKDSEGNGYSPLAIVDTCAYKEESTWYGYIGFEELTDDDRRAGFTEEDIIKDGIPAIVLWPTN